jgi:hypothetical protein
VFALGTCEKLQDITLESFSIRGERWSVEVKGRSKTSPVEVNGVRSRKMTLCLTIFWTFPEL